MHKKNAILYLNYSWWSPKFSSTQFIGGSVSKGSELQIEVAEFLWKDVEVTIKKIILQVLCPFVPN